MNSLLREKEQIIKLLKDKEIVSFDIFDTLVLRTVVDPTDIFKIVEIEYNKNNEQKLEVDFYKLRINTEKKVREKNFSKEEITFDDIYFEINKILGEEIGEKLKRLEIETEKKFIVINKFMYEIYKFCLEENKKIYIISDMYINKNFLRNLMINLGYKSFKNIYVSSEVGKTKATGNIYDYIKKQEGIEFENWIHIGDNYYADILNAQKNGINTYHYKKISERAGINSKIENISLSIIKALQINKLYTQNYDYWEEFGIKYASKIYFGIVKWLIENIEENIYFLSRDGYIINKIFEILNKNKRIKNRYLYTSRRAFQYAELADKDFDKIFECLVTYNSSFNQILTLRECLMNLDFDLLKYKKYLKGKISLETIVESQNKNEIKDFFRKIEKDIREQLKKERKILLEYLKQEKIFEYKKVNIFDIGWRGSIQKSMMDLTDKKINGYYLGTTSFLHKEIVPFSKGFIFDKGNPENIEKNILKNIMIYELLFSAPEGSLINFYRDEKDNKILPNLKNVEGNKNILEAIEKLQNASLEILKEYKKYENYIKILPSEAIEDLNEMLDKKDYKDLIEFSKLANTVGIGDSNDKKLYVSIYELEEYLTNRKRIHTEIEKNLWRNSFLIYDGQRYFTENEIVKLYDIEKIEKCKKTKYLKNIYKKIKVGILKFRNYKYSR